MLVFPTNVLRLKVNFVQLQIDILTWKIEYIYIYKSYSEASDFGVKIGTGDSGTDASIDTGGKVRFNLFFDIIWKTNNFKQLIFSLVNNVAGKQQ